MARYKLARYEEQDKLETVETTVYRRLKMSKGKEEEYHHWDCLTFYDDKGNVLSLSPREEQDRLKDKGLVKLTDGDYIPFNNLTEVNYRTLGGRCFIATVIYKDENASEVQVLRNFRDNLLGRNSLGRRLVKLYYSGLGEKTAGFLERHPSLIPVIKTGLDQLVEKYSSK